MKLSLHHIALKVHELQQCEEFYTSVLGLQVITRHRDEHGGFRSVWLDADGVVLMLERFDRAGDRGGSPDNNSREKVLEADGWHLVSFGISPGDREIWKDKLARQGVSIIRESDYSIYFRDPENNNLALSHYPTLAGQ